MPANLENAAVATGLENVSFHANPKERQSQKACSNYHTIALISHACKVMLKILQARLQQYMNHELPDIQDRFRKGRESEIILPPSILSLKKHESSRKKKIYFFFTDYAKAFDCVDHSKLWKNFKEMGMPGHLTCLLKNLYARKEVTVRTGYGTTYCFQIGKGVHQGCILSPCLFNFYAEYIM